MLEFATGVFGVVYNHSLLCTLDLFGWPRG
jgi:hypothetical protein